MTIGRMLERVLELVVPSLCIACGGDAGRAAPLCRGCRAQMGGPRMLEAGAIQCWAAFTYDGPAGALVRAVKFGGRRALADTMAGQIAAVAPARLLTRPFVPVPVHPPPPRRARGDPNPPV